MTRSVSFSPEKPDVVDWVDRKQLSEWENEDKQIALQRARDEGCTCAVVSLRLRMDVEDLIEEDTKERRLFDKLIKQDLAAALTEHDGLTIAVIAVRLGTENVLVSLVCTNGTVMGAVDELEKQARNPVSTLRKGRLTKSMMGALAVEYELSEQDTPTANTSVEGGDDEAEEEPASNPILNKVVDSRVVKKRKEDINFFEEDPAESEPEASIPAPAPPSSSATARGGTEGGLAAAMEAMKAEHEKACAEWAQRVSTAESHAAEAEQKLAKLEAKHEADRETRQKQVAEASADPATLYARIAELEEQLAKQSEGAPGGSPKSLSSKFSGFFGDSGDESDTDKDDSMFGFFSSKPAKKDPPKDKTKVGVEPNASATPPEGAEEKDDKEEDESDLMGKFKFW